MLFHKCSREWWRLRCYTRIPCVSVTPRRESPGASTTSRVHISRSLCYWMLHQSLISTWYTRKLKEHDNQPADQCVSNEYVIIPKSPLSTNKYPFYVITRMIINMIKLILYLMICILTIPNIFKNKMTNLLQDIEDVRFSELVQTWWTTLY